MSQARFKILLGALLLLFLTLKIFGVFLSAPLSKWELEERITSCTSILGLDASMSTSFVVAVVSIGVAMESFKLESKESSSYETDSFRSKITFSKE